MKTTIKTILAAACLFTGAALASAQDIDEGFVRGYATAVLDREFSLKPDGLVVVPLTTAPADKPGAKWEIRYANRGFGTLEKQQLEKSLGAIPGVGSVSLSDEVTPRSTTGTAAAGGGSDVGHGGRTVAAVAPVATSTQASKIFLSSGRLFEPLVADPRWPHFYASYNNYAKDGGAGFEHVGSVGFGETISILRESYPNGIRWEAGLQAGVFAIFDLNSDSMDLINADYFVGPYAALRFNDFSLLTRVFHQSSHLGDEYLLRDENDGLNRVNVSYEAVDMLLSYELPYGFRVYGGGGFLFDQEPSDIDPLMIQYGAEFRSPWTIAGGAMRPVFAADFQHREESDWDLDYSIRAGVQFEDPGRFSQRLMLMFEFYDGRSPNGQFYDERVQFYGLGLHFYF